MRILISAGEASGDLHGAAVIRALRARFPEMEFFGIAGPNMRAAGCVPLVDMSELAVMGFVEALRLVPRAIAIKKELLVWCNEQRPEAAILIDSYGFHGRLGQHLRAAGVPVLHYIAPKLWAWGAGRVQRLRRSQDRLAAILPFEPEWFARHGIAASYVGNPSAYACRSGWSCAELKARLDLPQEAPLLALLPGSRAGELARHVPLLAELVARLRRTQPQLHYVVPVAPGVDAALLAPLNALGVRFIARMEEGYALRADAAVAASGTATLELALWDVPTVLIYRSSAISVFLARRLATVRCAGLANILLGDRPVMPELLQEQATVAGIEQHLLPLLHDAQVAGKQRAEFARLRTLLGEEDPAESVAEMVAGMLRRR